MLVFAAIAPHGGPVFDDPDGATRKGMEELGRRFHAARPDAVIVLTPHGIHLDDHFAVVRSVRLAGDVAEWSDSGAAYDGPGDPALAEACIASLQADALPALGLTFGATAAGASTMPLDWGALIPLWFMRAPAVVISPCRARSNDEHVRAGAALVRATGARRVALIASADHGHGHRLPDGTEGPYGFVSESAPYDERIQELVRDDRLGQLAEEDPAWAVAAKADSFWQLLMLHGALGEAAAAGHSSRPELISYEAPTYFGMLTAAWSRED